MDIKAPLSKYAQVAGTAVDLMKLKKSIDLIKSSGIAYEFRSTLVEELLTEEEVLDMGEFLGRETRYFLQNFVPTKTLNEKFLQAVPFSLEKLNSLRDKFQQLSPEVHFR
jgi:pyruvate formate lyase activating enzyme